MRARRALLYMPGDDLRKIQKATTLDVDCVCMDMEDGVAANRKLESRHTITQALQTMDFGRSERLARINAIGSGFEEGDLQAVLPAHPEGIVAPKVESGDQVRWISDQISAAEQKFGWEPDGIGLIVLVETALGVVHLKEICTASPRLQAVIFGAEDLAGDIGAVRTPAAWEIFYARSAIVTYTAAYNLQAIDMVYVDFRDEAGLRKEAQRGVEMGFAGKQIIHPNQIAPVQETFTPSEAEIKQAQRIIEAARAHQERGSGAFALDGKMVDAPIVKAAARVLDRARAAGKA